MITYANLEQDIKTRLEADIPSADAEVLTAAENDARQKTFEKSRITIMYMSSEYDNEIIRGQPKSLSIGSVSQDEFWRAALVVESRFLRSDDQVKSVYWLLSKIRESLLGYETQHFGKVFFRANRWSPDETRDGVIAFMLTITGRRQIVQSDFDGLAGDDGSDLSETIFNNVIE